MRRAIPLILLLAVPAVACTAPDDIKAVPSPQASLPASSPPASPSSTPSATVRPTPTPGPSRPKVAWADMPPVSPTSIDFEPEQLGPPRGSVPVSEPVSAMVNQQPTKYTAVIINTPGLIVTLPDGKDLAERKKAIQATTKVPITFMLAVRSRAEQDRFQNELAKSLMKPHAPDDPPEVVGVGTDPRGATTVYCNEILDTTELRKTLKKRYGVKVVFEPGAVATLNAY